MSLTIGVDVGGTFTDVELCESGRPPENYKTPSTPEDPSVGFMEGLRLAAQARGLEPRELVQRIDRIVHGTTVTTNAVLTRTGARVGLLTTYGVRDALEMRRGIREEQYNNRQTNVEPLVPRSLRIGIRERIDRLGRESAPLQEEDVLLALEHFEREDVQAVAVCFLNSWANSAHEGAAKKLVQDRLPGRYVSVSSKVLPAIRFYDRLSTTVLSAYVGPILDHYLDRLVGRLEEAGFAGTLLIMQSSGGVVSPETARSRAALTLLSGPAAGPASGLAAVAPHGLRDCITVDMGGTSFDAALVTDGAAALRTEADIDRLRIALPTLDIATIGAGGGSVAWLDPGGLLRMGPKSAGARPGPVCYGFGGREPTCTDADLILGLLSAEFFAGGSMELDLEGARKAVADTIAGPLGLAVEEAAAGMYRVINSNMALGVRQVSVQRGVDPRNHSLVIAGGAGPLHACAIMEELEIPHGVVPRNASTFCASGMLLTDLEHDFVVSYPARLGELEWPHLREVVGQMEESGRSQLLEEGVPAERIEIQLAFDMRYVRQYHEVHVGVDRGDLDLDGLARIADAFHRRHAVLYGYQLAEEDTALEVINVRLRAVGRLDRTDHPAADRQAASHKTTAKGQRKVFSPELRSWDLVPVFDLDRLAPGDSVPGPALAEGRHTTVWITAGFEGRVDAARSLLLTRKGSGGPTR